MSGTLLMLPSEARTTHLHVIGQPGTGKSRGLESWIVQDAAAGRGVGVLDPHGDVFEHVLLRLAELVKRRPSLADRVVIINPLDPTWTVGFNPLEQLPGIPPERQAGFLTDVILKIWGIESGDAPRMERLLTFAFLILIESGLALADLPRLLTDRGFRDNLLMYARSEAKNYFELEFPKSDAAVHQWVTPVLNKIGALIFDPDIRLMLSGKNTVNFRRVLDQNLILLVNLSKGQLGEGASALLGAFVVAHLQKAALSRADTHNRPPFYLFLDEFQNYTTDNIRDILAESRKYGLSLILAHQSLTQLTTVLRNAVLTTIGTTVCFRVGFQDAAALAHELFPPEYLQTTSWGVKLLRLGRLPIPVPSSESEPLGQPQLVALLTQMANREFWAKRRGPYPPVKQRTLDMPDPVVTEELLRARDELRQHSGRRYGRLKSAITVLEYEQPLIPAETGRHTYYDER